MLLVYSTPISHSLTYASLLSLILQFDIEVREKYIRHRWVCRDGLISVRVTTSSPRLKAYIMNAR